MNTQLVIVKDLALRDHFAIEYPVPTDLANCPMIQVVKDELLELGFRFERLAIEQDTRVGLFFNRFPEISDDVQIAIVRHPGESWDDAGNRYAERSGMFSESYAVPEYRGLQYLEFVGWVDETV